VFSTLHTNDAPGAATRLVDMGVEPYLVALHRSKSVVAQRLVRVICTKCKVETPEADVQKLRDEFGDLVPPVLYHGTGCRHCQGTGYRGRQGIFEVMKVTDDIRSLVLHRSPSHEIRAGGGEARHAQPARGRAGASSRKGARRSKKSCGTRRKRKPERAGLRDVGAGRGGRLMGTFAYTALDRQGRRLSGTVPCRQQGRPAMDPGPRARAFAGVDRRAAQRQRRRGGRREQAGADARLRESGRELHPRAGEPAVRRAVAVSGVAPAAA
jgi:hypothetical protein